MVHLFYYFLSRRRHETVISRLLHALLRKRHWYPASRCWCHKYRAG